MSLFISQFTFVVALMTTIQRGKKEIKTANVKVYTGDYPLNMAISRILFPVLRCDYFYWNLLARLTFLYNKLFMTFFSMCATMCVRI